MRASLLALPLLLAIVGPVAAQSTATVSAAGTDLRVLVDQSRSINSSVTIDQVGAGGGTVATQDGQNAALSLTMNGNDQEHDIAQTSAGDAGITVNSLGDRNSSGIVQDVGALGRGEITLLQTGSDNRAELSQTTEAAGYNSMALNQLGNDNVARLTQRGSNNSVDLTQNGSGLAADITQDGAGLSFGMTQTGANTPITITQTRQ